MGEFSILVNVSNFKEISQLILIFFAFDAWFSNSSSFLFRSSISASSMMFWSLMLWSTILTPPLCSSSLALFAWGLTQRTTFLSDLWKKLNQFYAWYMLWFLEHVRKKRRMSTLIFFLDTSNFSLSIVLSEINLLNFLLKSVLSIIQ